MIKSKVKNKKFEVSYIIYKQLTMTQLQYRIKCWNQKLYKVWTVEKNIGKRYLRIILVWFFNQF